MGKCWVNGKAKLKLPSGNNLHYAIDHLSSGSDTFLRVGAIYNVLHEIKNGMSDTFLI